MPSPVYAGLSSGPLLKEKGQSDWVMYGANSTHHGAPRTTHFSVFPPNPPALQAPLGQAPRSWRTCPRAFPSIQHLDFESLPYVKFYPGHEDAKVRNSWSRWLSKTKNLIMPFSSLARRNATCLTPAPFQGLSSVLPLVAFLLF